MIEFIINTIIVLLLMLIPKYFDPKSPKNCRGKFGRPVP